MLPPDGGGFRWSITSLGLAAVVALALGLLGGFLKGRTSPTRAALQRLGDRVTVEADVGDVAATGSAPTSGARGAAPVCGVIDAAVPPDVQVATLAIGGVILQHDELDAVERRDLVGLVDAFASHVLVAPGDVRDGELVATAWRRRMVLDDLDVSLARAFIVAFRLRGPEPGACPVAPAE